MTNKTTIIEKNSNNAKNGAYMVEKYKMQTMQIFSDHAKLKD